MLFGLDRLWRPSEAKAVAWSGPSEAKAVARQSVVLR
jgi:hypothetical protein